MPKLTPEQRLAKAKEELARAQAEIKDRERKNDTRRKIVIGAMLIEDAKNNASYALYLVKLMSRLKRPSDKAAFAGWEMDVSPEVEKKILEEVEKMDGN